MSASTLIYLVARVLHVVTAALWLGAGAFLVFMLSPAVEQAGAAGGAVMGRLGRRGLNAYMASLSGMTMLTGIWLYWRFTGGFDPVVSRTTAGMVFGAGGVLGIIAGIVGGSVVGRGSQRMLQLGEQMTSMPDGPEKNGVAREMQQLGKRVGAAATFVVICMLVAAALMALGHYV